MLSWCSGQRCGPKAPCLTFYGSHRWLSYIHNEHTCSWYLVESNYLTVADPIISETGGAWSGIKILGVVDYFDALSCIPYVFTERGEMEINSVNIVNWPMKVHVYMRIYKNTPSAKKKSNLRGGGVRSVSK